MFYTYVLLSKKDKRFYIGYSEDLKRRVQEHRLGLVPATRPRQPLLLVFYEAYLNKYDALRRERYLKTAKGKTTLRSMLLEFLNKEVHG